MPTAIIGGVPIEIDEQGNPIGAGFEPPPADGTGSLSFGPNGEAMSGLTSIGGAAPAASTPTPAPQPQLADPFGAGPQLADPFGVTQAEAAGEKRNVSVSKTGQNDARLKKNRGGYQAVLSQEDQLRAEENQRAAQEAQPFVDAGKQDMQATADETEAAAAQFDAKALGEQRIADLQNQFQTALDESYKVSKALANDYRAKVEQSLAELNAMDINPGQLWGAMEGWERGGMGWAAFVQGFLGAKGIKTDALQIFNQSVERNIQGQVEKLRKQEKVADGFKMLWDMARAEGADEREAMQVIHAHALAAAEKEVAAAVGKYDSALARARGSKAIAAIRTDLATRLADITQRAEQRVQERLKMRLDAEFNAQKLAIEKSQVALGWANHKLRKEEIAEQKRAAAGAADAQAAQRLDELAITDPKSGQLVKRARTKGDAEDIRMRLAGQQEVVDSAAEVRDMLTEANEIYGGWGKAMLNSDFRQRAMAARDRFLVGYAKSMSGATYSAAELEKYERIASMDTWLSEPPVEKIYSDHITEVGRKVQSEINARTSDFTAGDLDLISKGLVVGSNPDSYKFAHSQMVDADIRRKGVGRKETIVDKAMQKVDAPDAGKTTRNVSRDVIDDWREAGNEVRNVYDWGKDGAAPDRDEVPKYAAGINDLYRAAKSSGDQGLRQRALDTLGALATGSTHGADGKSTDDQAAFAQYYLQRLAEELPETKGGGDLEIPDVSDIQETAMPRGFGSLDSSDVFGGASEDRKNDERGMKYEGRRRTIEVTY